MHTAYVASEGWEIFWQGPLGHARKGHVANMIFGYFVLNVVLSVPEDGMTTAQLNNTPWPFNLIVKRVAVPPMKEELRLYRPCSDLLILKSTLPRLLVEVNSSETKEWPPDLIRMLLKGAAIVRFANTFLDAFKEKDFVLVAIFIRDDGKATHILTVYRPSDPSKELIAKKVRNKSNELEILKLLNTIQPKSEHVISLLDSFHTQSGPWAILSKMDTVADYVAIAHNQLGGRVAQVCRGLIKGLAYLHKFCIAHRDIKPDNLVVDQDFCLKIIDFDIAMQVKDEDEEIDGKCGTKHWMAPEVEDKSSTYSPIKADRWSCGRVLLYLLNEFRKENKLLRAIAGKLKAHDPKQRPSLLEWHTWFTTPPLDVANVRKGGERKASRPRQDAMENTKPPKTKRQRLIVSDRNEREREV
ncbi:kinase-like domain-containing protein [Lactifluus subvellereus]|nr:kinase-like domain-containing protein [Lactifluus subvellereus]